MIVFPSREKYIKENFFELSFEEKRPDFEKFKSLNSAEMHYLVEIFNWDDGTEILNWIIDSDKCDSGTALMIFWRSSPDYYLGKDRIEEYDNDIFKLLEKIIQRFKLKNFKKSNIKYNLAEDFDTEYYISEIEKWSLPQEMLKPTRGFRPMYLGILLEVLKKRLKKSRKRR